MYLYYIQQYNYTGYTRSIVYIYNTYCYYIYNIYCIIPIYYIYIWNIWNIWNILYIQNTYVDSMCMYVGKRYRYVCTQNTRQYSIEISTID